MRKKKTEMFEERKTDRINLMVKPSFKRGLQEYCKWERITMSEYIVELIEKDQKKKGHK